MARTNKKADEPKTKGKSRLEARIEGYENDHRAGDSSHGLLMHEPGSQNRKK